MVRSVWPKYFLSSGFISVWQEHDIERGIVREERFNAEPIVGGVGAIHRGHAIVEGIKDEITEGLGATAETIDVGGEFAEDGRAGEVDGLGSAAEDFGFEAVDVEFDEADGGIGEEEVERHTDQIERIG